MRLLKLLGHLIMLIALCISCGRKLDVPDGLLQPDELIPLLVEMHLVDAHIQQIVSAQAVRKDSAFKIYPGILKKYNISRPLIDSTILFYGQHPKEFAKIYDEVLERFSKMSGDLHLLQDTTQVDEY